MNSMGPNRKKIQLNEGLTRRAFLEKSGLTIGGVLVSGILSSCGGTAATEKALKRASMRLMWLPQAQFTGPYVAMDKGFYHEEGLDLTVSPGGPNLYPTNLVATQTDQFGTLGPSAVVSGRDKGLPLKLILVEFNDDHIAMVAKADSGINRPKDFEGKKVAVWYGELQYRLRGMVAEDGGNPDLMEEIAQGADLTPFIEGQWDVCSTCTFNELVTLRDERKLDLNIFHIADSNSGVPAQGVVCADKVIENDPDMVKAFVKGTIRGWKWALENPEGAVDIVMKFGEDLDRAHQTAMLMECLRLLQTGQVPTKGIGYIDPERVQHTIDFLFEHKVVAAKPNLADCYWPGGWEATPDSDKKI